MRWRRVLAAGWLLAGVVSAQAEAPDPAPAPVASSAASAAGAPGSSPAVPLSASVAAPSAAQPARPEALPCSWSSPPCLASAAIAPLPWLLKLGELWLRALPGLLGALLALVAGLAGLHAVLAALRLRPGPGDPRMPPSPPGQGFSFRRHWGGLGGESTGWSASPQVVQLLVGIGLLLLGVALMMAMQPQAGGWLVAQAGAPAAPASAASRPAPH